MLLEHARAALRRLERLVEVVKRPAPFSLAVKEEGAVASGPGRMWPEGNGRLIMCHGPRVLTDALAKVAEIKMRPVVLRFELSRPKQPRDDGLCLAFEVAQQGPFEAIAGRLLVRWIGVRAGRRGFAGKFTRSAPADFSPGTTW